MELGSARDRGLGVSVARDQGPLATAGWSARQRRYRGHEVRSNGASAHGVGLIQRKSAVRKWTVVEMRNG